MGHSAERDGIEAALAAGLAAHAHRWRGALLRCRQPCEWTASSGALPDRDQLAEHRAHVAAALLPVVTQQAEAIREAASVTRLPFCAARNWRWLRDRAARIARADESGAQ